MKYYITRLYDENAYISYTKFSEQYTISCIERYIYAYVSKQYNTCKQQEIHYMSYIILIIMFHLSYMIYVIKCMPSAIADVIFLIVNTL